MPQNQKVEAVEEAASEVASEEEEVAVVGVAVLAVEEEAEETQCLRPKKAVQYYHLVEVN